MRPGAPGWLERRAGLVTLALVALELALVLPRVGAQGIWFDEAVTMQNGQQPFDLARNLRADATPPLYALAVRLWMLAFGVSLETARLLSVAASAATVALVFRFGVRFVGARAALLATLLLVVSRFQVFFAHEARPYALVVLLCVASFAALVALLEEPRPARVVLLGVLDAALLYTHYVAAFALVAQAVAVLAHGPRERRVLTAFAASQAVAGLTFLPLALYLATIWPLPMAGWLATPTPWSFVVELAKLAGDGPLLLAETVVAGGALLWIVRSTDARGRLVPGRALLLASWAFVPLVAAYAVSLVEPVFLARYLLYAAPGLFLLLGYLVASTPAPASVQGSVGALLCAWSLWLAVGDPIVRPGWREAAEIVRGVTARGGVAFVVPAHQLLPFGYHFAREAFADVATLPESLRAARVFGLPDATRLVEARFADVREVVVVLEGPHAGDEARITQGLGPQHLVPAGRDALPGLLVLRYAPAQARVVEPGIARGLDSPA